LGKLYYWVDAVKECNQYKGGGYTDWYLPSKDELNQMYKNLHKNALGGFDNFAFYWSSTEGDDDDVWVQYLMVIRARAVRSATSLSRQSGLFNHLSIYLFTA
jgi:hypothetical protein